MFAWSASAAGPYVVDDADIADLNTLQNEDWISQTNKGETLEVINGAYQILKNTELTLQATHNVQHGNHSDILSPQMKYLWRNGEGDTVRSSVVIGSEYLADGGRMSDFYAYVPASLRATDKLDVNVDLGGEYIRQTGQHIATWGIGTEYHATPELSFVSEVFGDDRETPGFQLGPHYVVSKAMELDLVYGHNVFNQSEDVVTAGLTLNL